MLNENQLLNDNIIQTYLSIVFKQTNTYIMPSKTAETIFMYGKSPYKKVSSYSNVHFNILKLKLLIILES